MLLTIVIVILLMAFFPGVIRFILSVILLGLVSLVVWTAVYPHTLTMDWDVFKLLLEGAFHVAIITFLAVVVYQAIREEWKR